MFFELQRAWGNIPFAVVNDGEVTALAGSMAFNENAVLGHRDGHQPGGRLCDAGRQYHQLAERTRLRAAGLPGERAVDEWSGDRGVGARYFSQQAVGRLAPSAGLELAGRHAASRNSWSKCRN